jgi:hypothetical protein
LGASSVSFITWPEGVIALYSNMGIFKHSFLNIRDS